MTQKVEYKFEPQAIETLRSYQDPSLPDLVEAMKKMFETQSQEFLSSLSSDLSTHNHIELCKAAHKFKSSCNHLGARSLADVCMSIETLTKSIPSQQGWDDLLRLGQMAQEHLEWTLQRLKS